MGEIIKGICTLAVLLYFVSCIFIIVSFALINPIYIFTNWICVYIMPTIIALLYGLGKLTSETLKG